MCAHVCMCEHTHLKTQVNLGWMPFLIHLSTLFQRHGLSLAWNHQFVQASWPASLASRWPPQHWNYKCILPLFDFSLHGETKCKCLQYQLSSLPPSCGMAFVTLHKSTQNVTVKSIHSYNLEIHNDIPQGSPREEWTLLQAGSRMDSGVSYELLVMALGLNEMHTVKKRGRGNSPRQDSRGRSMTGFGKMPLMALKSWLQFLMKCYVG